jgi:EmrB/QacA subfamily drug resistance transporter
MRADCAVRPPLVLAICCLSLFIVGVDNTIVTIALPAIRTSLHASFASAQWTVDAYQIVLGAFLVSAGATADRWGRRRTLQAGLGIFAAGSLLCGISASVGWLIAFRVVQALGGSMMNPVALAIVSHVYPDPRRRAKAFGVWSGVYGLSMAAGPVTGGLLVAYAGWRSIFWTTVPIAIAAIALCARFVPESKGLPARRIDPIGQALLVCGLTALTFSIIEGHAFGWTSGQVVAPFAVFCLSSAGFLRWEARHPEPLIDLGFFRSIPFSAGTCMALIGMASAGGYLWVITFYLQDARGLSPQAAGFILLPVAAAVLAIAPMSGRIAARHGPRVPLIASGIGLAVSALMLAGLRRQTPEAVLIGSFLAFGAGFGMLNAPITSISVSGMPPSRSGVAAAVASTGRQVGQAMGVAIVGALVIPRLTPNFDASLSSASHPGFWAIALGGFCVACIAALATTRRGARSAARCTTRPPPS